jgi:hypothetical protein
VILQEAGHRTLEDGAKLEAFKTGGLAKFVLEIPGDTADTGNGELTTAVRRDMTRKEGTEIVYNEVVDGFHVDVGMNELGERTEESVGQRLTVHTIDDNGQRKPRLCLKVGLELIRQSTAIEIMQKPFAKHCPTPFVTYDITQSRRVLNNRFTIIKTRISTSS